MIGEAQLQGKGIPKCNVGTSANFGRNLSTMEDTIRELVTEKVITLSVKGEVSSSK